MSKKQRQLTVHPYFINTKYTSKIYSSIKLSGKWLQDCGFSPQDKVQITVDNEVLIIELIK